jgi:hypothetical protein
VRERREKGGEAAHKLWKSINRKEKKEEKG